MEDEKMKVERLLEVAGLRRRIAELEHAASEEQLVMRTLRESQEQLRRITDTLPTIISYVDSEQRYRFNNRAYEEWFGLCEAELCGRHIREILGEKGYREIQEYVELALSGKTVCHERAVSFRDGSLRYINAVYVPHSGPSREVWGFISLGIDVTNRVLAEVALQKAHDEMEKQVEERTARLREANERMAREIEVRRRTEERLIYLGMRDTLTGLYNRTYFEEYMHRLEKEDLSRVGIIACDLDGLKLVNHSFGHEVGDKLLKTAAGIIRRCSSPFGTVARIGGDEFTVLFQDVDPVLIEKISNKMRRALAKYNRANPKLPLSISIGIAVGAETSSSMADLIREADNSMYREKLLNSRSARNAVLQILMRTLEARDFLTEGHLNRLQAMVTRLATVVGMSESKVSALRLLAQFHDIGKVGIPDLILFKPASLSAEEVLEMRRHCEIGHHIALASPELAGIAEWILMHHECWNGSGYPLGLKGEEIPLECRILAVADAYDAMTSTRPYRNALDCSAAVAELQRCAGTQFDPLLVSRLVPELLRIREGAS
jgi:diguanylate cyclase (GGDEF)-like protein/PAS domain S-box-containing protein